MFGMKNKVEKNPIRDPWLVQRCKSRDFNPSLKTSEYLNLDYMGAAEFEWGALPEWQREMNSMLDRLVIKTVTLTGEMDERTVVGDSYYFMIDRDRVEQYFEVMHKIIRDDVKTKMGIRLRAKETLWVGKSKKPMYDQPHAPFQYDCWWDITNTAAFARDPQILENLKVTIPNSVRFMDSRKGKS